MNVEEVKKRVLIRPEELVDAQQAASQSSREAQLKPAGNIGNIQGSLLLFEIIMMSTFQVTLESDLSLSLFSGRKIET